MTMPTGSMNKKISFSLPLCMLAITLSCWGCGSDEPNEEYSSMLSDISEQIPDGDGDGIPDERDNCPTVANVDQADCERDGLGDACDQDHPGSGQCLCYNNRGDPDGDGICNDIDNCQGVANPDQVDTNQDGLGDACTPPGWSRTFGGGKDDISMTLQETSDKGFIITGLTGSFGAGMTDVWLIRTDSTGHEVWSKTFGGSGIEIGASVQETSDGGFIITGETESFGAGKSDVWLIRTDNQGNKIWDKTFGDEHNQAGQLVRLSRDGGVIILAYNEATGPDLSSLWLIKTDSQGNKLWDKTFSGTNGDSGIYLQETNDDGFIIVGHALTEAGDWDIWLLRTDSAGNELWRQTFGGAMFDMSFEVHETADGGFIIVGQTESFGAGDTDAWLIRTDNMGNKLWDKTFGDKLEDSGSAVRETNDGGFVMTGYTQSHGLGWVDLWLLKIDSQGNTLWDKAYGGESTDVGIAMEEMSDGSFVLIGYTDSYGAGDCDAWLLKTDSMGNGPSEPQP